MVQDTYTPLLSEILKKVNNAKTKSTKVEVLQKYDCDALRALIKSSFDPNIEWVIPKGEVPFRFNDAVEGTEHTVLRREYKKLYRFIKGGDAQLVGFKRENLFIQLLEGLHKDEATLILQAKDKKLHQSVKGLSAAVVKEAFNWNDEFAKETQDVNS
tara:strand:+ start:1184 stop:1654 length:471 start_codon:yes stop_codon:yes gene_type:complete